MTILPQLTGSKTSSISLSLYLSMYLSIYVSLSIYLSICLSIFTLLSTVRRPRSVCKPHWFDWRRQFCCSTVTYRPVYAWPFPALHNSGISLWFYMYAHCLRVWITLQYLSFPALHNNSAGISLWLCACTRRLPACLPAWSWLRIGCPYVWPLVSRHHRQEVNNKKHKSVRPRMKSQRRRRDWLIGR